MDNRTRPIGTLETVAICLGIAVLAGVAVFALLLVLAGWSFLQAFFMGFVVACILALILTLSFGRELPRPGEAGAISGEAATRDAPDVSTASLMPRDISAPSPHKDSIEWSDISETAGPDLDSPGVNKARGDTPGASVPAAAGAAVPPAETSGDGRKMPSRKPGAGGATSGATSQAAKPAAAAESAGAASFAAAEAADMDEADAAEIAGADAGAAADAAAKAAAEKAAADKAAADKAAADKAAAEAAAKAKAAATADTPSDAGPGTKPAALEAARDGKADDLKRIKGIGPKLEKLCNTLGFYHFDQIAAWTPDEVAWVDQNLEGFKGRVTRDEWVSQAKLLAEGGETAFSQKVDKGGVY